MYNLKLKICGLKQELLVKKIINEVQKIDSIENFAEFCCIISPYLEKRIYLTHTIYGSESFHYGHLNALYDYAGLKKRPNGKLFPVMEHAAAYQIVRHRKPEDIHRNISYIYQSKYMKQYIHDIDEWKPVFCIGCYLHYVKPYYSEEKEKQIKSKFGKVLLVIASHNLETQECQYDDEKFVDFVMNYATENKFDTVLVSVYFSDINLDMYNNFRKRGAVLVSAGFREDPNFIHRLKSIFSLADLVLTNAIGSPVGFSKYMGKPYLLVQEEANMLNEQILYKDDICLANQQSNFDKLRIVSRQLNLSEQEKQIADKLYNYYTGEDELLRTPEEIRAIESILNKIYHKSKGKVNRFPKTIKMLLDEFEKNGQMDFLEYKLLKESLGN